MDWNAKATWIGSSGSGISLDRLRASFRMGTVYVSPRDPGAGLLVGAIRSARMVPGLYSDPHWYGLAADGAALRYRQQLDADCARLLHPDEPLMLDLEQVSAEYVRRLVNGAVGNRGLVGSNNPLYDGGTQAARPLAYTNEPFKDGTVVPIDVLAAASTHWYPQLYYGDMSPADAAAIVLEILRWCDSIGVGGYAASVHPFYDGARWASDQRDGAWFTAERLPGVFGFAMLAKTRAAHAEKASVTRATLRELHTAPLGSRLGDLPGGPTGEDRG